MRHAKWGAILLVTLLAIGTASLFGGATTPASGQDGQGTGGPICGSITSTVVIVRDAWLACDVQCLQTLGPCVSFGRPNIKFSLNGFKMTGPANEPSRNQCSAAGEFGQEMDGIHSKFDEVQIVGPGVIQRMKRHGIGLVGEAPAMGAPPVSPNPVEKAQVKKVTSHMNCFSGIFLFWTNETLVDEAVAVKNSANGQMRPCGGICVTNSSRNVVRRSEVAGNGTTELGPPPAAIPNDFGIGLVGASHGNLIEENGVGGNINGLAIFPAGGSTPTNNLIKKNVFAGNPPTEVYDKFGPEAGSDVRDFAGTAARNRFEENLCLTYTVATGLSPVAPAPCAGSQHDAATATRPKVPQYAGHQNN
jgi:Right handed beta helix region